MQYPVPGRARLLALAEEEPEEHVEQEHAVFGCPCRWCCERRAEEREQLAREDAWNDDGGFPNH